MLSITILSIGTLNITQYRKATLSITYENATLIERKLSIATLSIT
jgi:hypothetical protein